jgi:uncharacterized protein YkwD
MFKGPVTLIGAAELGDSSLSRVDWRKRPDPCSRWGLRSAFFGGSVIAQALRSPIAWVSTSIQPDSPTEKDDCKIAFDGVDILRAHPLTTVEQTHDMEQRRGDDVAQWQLRQCQDARAMAVTRRRHSKRLWFHQASIAVAAVAAAFAIGTGSASGNGDLEILRRQALELVNQDRKQHDLEPLEFGSSLNKAAQSHAQDMQQRSYYAHVSPDGETVQDRYVKAGGDKWRLVAENISRCAGCTNTADKGSIERLHRGWMQSPEHRLNILRRGIDHFGFGIAVDAQQGLYAVQTFAGPGLPRGLQAGEQPVALAPEQLLHAALQRINAAREKAGRQPLESSSSLSAIARSALPKEDTGEFQLSGQVQLFQRLSPDQRRQWQSLSMLAAACGGCGVEPTRADVKYFTEQWLDDPQYQKQILAGDLTHLGFAIAENDKGKKIAVALLGQRL